MIFTRKPDIHEYTDFGYHGSSDYTIHKDVKRKQQFLSRFQKKIKENENDPSSPMTLSRMILWNLPTIEESFQDYKKKFHFE
jgi:hypothetical protein